MIEKVQIGVIDLTPSWSEVFPVLLLVYTDGTTTAARNGAFQELERMASLADKYVELQKEKT
jgi:hypothetical protein